MQAGKMWGLVAILFIFAALFSGCVVVEKKGPPAAVIVAKPPRLVLIKEIEVYYAPDVDIELYFYKSYWYWYYGKHWHWSRYYNGPWEILPPGKVPPPLYKIPPGIRKKLK